MREERSPANRLLPDIVTLALLVGALAYLADRGNR